MVNKAPRVSVLMPAYNHQKHVAQAIESVSGKPVRTSNWSSTDRPAKGFRLFRKGLSYSGAKYIASEIAFLLRALALGYGRHLAVSALPSAIRIQIQRVKRITEGGRMQRRQRQ